MDFAIFLPKALSNIDAARQSSSRTEFIIAYLYIIIKYKEIVEGNRSQQDFSGGIKWWA